MVQSSAPQHRCAPHCPLPEDRMRPQGLPRAEASPSQSCGAPPGCGTQPGEPAPGRESRLDEGMGLPRLEGCAGRLGTEGTPFSRRDHSSRGQCHARVQ